MLFNNISQPLFICIPYKMKETTAKVSSMNDKFLVLKKYNLWGGTTPQVGFIRKSYTDKIWIWYRL